MNNELTELSYYARYKKMTTRYQIIGAVLLLISIVINYVLGHSPVIFHVIFTAPGVLLLVIGGSSARPHNVIKSFAIQCARTPGKEIAEGLLDAINAAKKIALVKSTIQSVYTGIEVYAELPDADPELVTKLREAADQRITKKLF